MTMPTHLSNPMNPAARLPRQRSSRRWSPIRWAFLLLTGLGLVAALPATAQQGAFELGLGASLTRLDDKLGGDSGLGLDLRAGYFLTDRFALEVQHSQASSILDGSFSATTLNAVYHLASAKRFVPYVLVGIGQANVELDGLLSDAMDDDSTALRAAVGGRFGLGAGGRTALRVEFNALSEDSFDDRATHLGLTTSFSWRLGGGG